MRGRLSDISLRRSEAFLAGPGVGVKEALTRIEDATTTADIDTLHEAREILDDFSRQVLDLYVEVWRGFGKYRCAVCGRTEKQSADIGYDCAREC